MKNRASATLALLCALALAVSAQGPAPVTPVMTIDSAGDGPFDRLHFRNIGPATPSGRVDDVAVLESNPAVFYVAGATSGVWKTENMGTTFTPVFDHQGSSSVGDIAIAATDANLLWVGTGENNNRQSSSWGDGVYKSADGGRTWQHMGLRDSKQIARIIVDPVDFDVVYVAALGDLWAAGGERGVYKTIDGGQKWQRVLHVDDDTGATELLMDPNNNKVVYAATYQRRRQPWGMNGGGQGSAIWKSSDAGATWTKLGKGIPEGPKGRIGMDVWHANPNVLYARIEHPEESGVYRSDDAGASWRKLSDTNPRPMYFSQIRIDPTNDARIYNLGVRLHVSDDGGRTWSNDGAPNIHVDHHAMWINPANPNHIVLGNDGGVAISHDRAATWVYMTNLPFAQAYHVAFDMQTPYQVCAGLQDNNTWCGPSAVRTNSGINNDDWYVINGGDGFQPLMDPDDARVLYGESQNGRMSRIDRLTNERTTLRPEPADGEDAYRWNWDTAMTLSPHDAGTIYVGANRLFRSSNRGRTWEAISPDLTSSADLSAFEIMGVKDADIKIAKHDGVSNWSSLVTIAESPVKPGVLWTGSDDGVVSMSPESGKSWTNVTDKLPGVPAKTYVSKVAPSRFEARTAYVTFDGHRSGDYGTYVYVTTDFGGSFRSIAGNLPKGEVARTITEDLKNPDVLYLGTETGIWVTLDRGKQWTRVKANLPTVPVYEIVLHPRDNDMIVGTHGRAIWILDDLAPFQQWSKSDAAPGFVFEPPPAITFNAANDQMKGFEGDRRFLGLNPVAGVKLTYRLRADAKELKWTIRDSRNNVVREISGDALDDAKKAGLNSVAWDLRVQPLEPLRNQQGQSGGGGGGGFGGGGNNGPFVLPGTYRATLNVDGRDANTVNVVVSGDRDIQITEADRKTWHDTAMALHQLQRRANESADSVNAAWRQFESLQQQTRDRNVPANLKSQMDALAKEFDGVRRRLGLAGGGGFGNTENVRGRIGQVKSQVMNSTALPTDTQVRQAKELPAAFAKLEAEAKAVTAKVAPLAKELMNAGVLYGS